MGEAATGPRLPFWALPARVAAVVHPGLRASIEPDVSFVRTLPGPALTWPLAVVALAVVPAILRAFIRIGPATENAFVIVVADVYTESLPFMVLAVIVGVAAPTLGVVLLVCHAVADLFAAARSTVELSPLPTAILGRAVAYWLLWLLVIEIPLISRAVEHSDGLKRGSGATRVALRVASFAAAVGTLTYVWTQAVTVLIRPVFVWSNLRQPQYQAIWTVQEQGVVIALIAAAAAVAIGLYRRPLALEFELPLETPMRRAFLPRPPSVLTSIMSAALIVVALGGVIASVLDVVILFGALTIARPLSRLVVNRLRVGSLLSKRTPWILRFLAGFFLTYLIGLAVMPPLWRFFPSEFFPLVITIALGAMIFEVLLGEPPAHAEEGTPSRTRVLLLFLVLGSTIGFAGALMAPTVALAGSEHETLADNCGSRYDCYVAPLAAAGGAAGAAAWAIGQRGAQGSRPPRPSDKEILRKAERAIDLIGKLGGEAAPSWQPISLPPGVGLVAPAPTGVSAWEIPMALVNKLIEWQFEMTRKISRALGGDPPRSDYKVIESADRFGSLRVLSPGASPDRLKAVEELIAAGLEIGACGRAAIVSFDRYGGARVAGDRTWAREQGAALQAHKRNMGRALLRGASAIESYRNVRVSEGDHDAPLSDTDVRVYQESLRAHGFSPSEILLGHAFGITDAEIEQTRQEQISADPTSPRETPNKYLMQAASTYRELGRTLLSLPRIDGAVHVVPEPDVPAQDAGSVH
jgi:hypothetical protein